MIYCKTTEIVYRDDYSDDTEAYVQLSDDKNFIAVVVNDISGECASFNGTYFIADGIMNFSWVDYPEDKEEVDNGGYGFANVSSEEMTIITEREFLIAFGILVAAGYI